MSLSKSKCWFQTIAYTTSFHGIPVHGTSLHGILVHGNDTFSTCSWNDIVHGMLHSLPTYVELALPVMSHHRRLFIVPCSIALAAKISNTVNCQMDFWNRLCKRTLGLWTSWLFVMRTSKKTVGEGTNQRYLSQIDYFTMESLLKGKDQYSWPPCTY